MKRLIIVLFLVILHISCSTPPIRTSLECFEAGTRVNDLWYTLQEIRTAGGCVGNGSDNRCESIRRQIERISFVCPNNTAALLGSAILAYDRRELFRAQQLLDDLLSRGGLNPAAAALRGRIALDEGNIPFATRFLQEQIRLNPDNAELRETLAASFYLAGQYDLAEDQLAAAGRFGTPRWRIAYHLGLIAEARRNFSAAQGFYEETLQLRPGWTPAESRLRGVGVNLPDR
jgi:tetratricopeptide (TPR) repeat protein